jgi:hypothetical protein
MKVRIRYHNKPHDIRVVATHLIPLTKNILQLYVSFNVRGMEVTSWVRGMAVNSWGSSSNKPNVMSIFFEDGKDIRVEVIVDAGFPIGSMPGHLTKTTYHAIVVEGTLMARKWNEHCRRLTAEKRARNIKKGV